MENGWQGGPPETNSTRSCHCVRSTWRMSLSKRRRSEPIARCQFSRKVLQESVSRSTTATGLNPASCNPRARPPPPANSSIAQTLQFVQREVNAVEAALESRDLQVGE